MLLIIIMCNWNKVLQVSAKIQWEKKLNLNREKDFASKGIYMLYECIIYIYVYMHRSRFLLNQLQCNYHPEENVYHNYMIWTELKTTYFKLVQQRQAEVFSIFQDIQSNVWPVSLSQGGSTYQSIWISRVNKD